MQHEELYCSSPLYSKHAQPFQSRLFLTPVPYQRLNRLAPVSAVSPQPVIKHVVSISHRRPCRQHPSLLPHDTLILHDPYQHVLSFIYQVLKAMRTNLQKAAEAAAQASRAAQQGDTGAPDAAPPAKGRAARSRKTPAAGMPHAQGGGAAQATHDGGCCDTIQCMP
jgi:hypothetical protein